MEASKVQPQYYDFLNESEFTRALKKAKKSQEEEGAYLSKTASVEGQLLGLRSLMPQQHLRPSQQPWYLTDPSLTFENTTQIYEEGQARFHTILTQSVLCNENRCTTRIRDGPQ